jgi:hypothetical protein
MPLQLLVLIPAIVWSNQAKTFPSYLNEMRYIRIMVGVRRGDRALRCFVYRVHDELLHMLQLTTSVVPVCMQLGHSLLLWFVVTLLMGLSLIGWLPLSALARVTFMSFFVLYAAAATCKCLPVACRRVCPPPPTAHRCPPLSLTTSHPSLPLATLASVSVGFLPMTAVCIVVLPKLLYVFNMRNLSKSQQLEELVSEASALARSRLRACQCRVAVCCEGVCVPVSALAHVNYD